MFISGPCVHMDLTPRVCQKYLLVLCPHLKLTVVFGRRLIRRPVRVCRILIFHFLATYVGPGVLSTACRIVGGGGVGLIMFMCACVTLGMLRCATVMYTCVTHGMLRSATLLPSLEATDLTLLRDWGGLCLSCGREGLILGSGVGQVIIPSS